VLAAAAALHAEQWAATTEITVRADRKRKQAWLAAADENGGASSAAEEAFYAIEKE
jgi:hypothetical protein